MRRRKPSNAELLQASVRDADAFGVFYDRFEAPVLRYFLRTTGRPDWAADLTAETFASALGSRAKYRPEAGTPQAWLFGIARHILADALHRGRVEDRARSSLGMEPLAWSDDQLERIEELLSSSTQIMEALHALPEDQRLAVHLRVVEEREYHDLAAHLDCSQSVARQRVSRGLRSIRTRLRASPLVEESS